MISFCFITSMEKSVPSRLSNLRELLTTLQLSVQVQQEISAILEENERRLYSLEEDRRRLIADYRALDERTRSLEKRYSELLYRFSEIKKDM